MTGRDDASMATVSDDEAPCESLSVVVPVYNSAATLSLLVERLKIVLPTIAREFELLLIDDGSGDHSWLEIDRLVQDHAWIRGLKLLRNSGQHNALLCGIRAARHEITVTLDDDLQHPPEAIRLLIARLLPGNDVVYGCPERQQHGLIRDLASSAAKYVMQRALGVNSARSASAFRAFRTSLRDAFAAHAGPYVCVDVLLTWSTTRFDAISVPHAPRVAGHSQYTVRKLVAHATNMITGFSTLPLRAASLMGFGFTIFGAGVLSYVLCRYSIHGTSAPGFVFLAAIISIFSGIQLFALGVIGEYMARMYLRAIGQPTYTVELQRGFPAECHERAPIPFSVPKGCADSGAESRVA